MRYSNYKNILYCGKDIDDVLPRNIFHISLKPLFIVLTYNV